MNWLVELVSRLLEPDEREAVRGDLKESGETSARALRDLLSLVARRQAALWKDWRPWLALVGLAVPLGVLFSVVAQHTAETSATYAWMYVNNWTMTYIENAGFRQELLLYALSFAVGYLTLIWWSWTIGFALGSLSRGAVWINGAFFGVVLFGRLLFVEQRSYGDNAAAFASGFYRSVFPVIVRITLVLIPAAWGMYKGSRLGALSLWQTALWAAALTGLSVWSGTFAWWYFPVRWELRLLLLRAAVVWPVVYMACTASRRHWHRRTVSP
jgi:hypothetical protein